MKITKSDIKITGARENNLKDISVVIPKGRITVFTGVSGSGKSSLVFDTIAAESQRLLNETYDSFIRHRLQKYGKPEVDGIENLSVAIIVDQKRIGGNSRSTVGTVTDIYSLLRLLYSRIGEPFVGYSTVLSFNNPQGMCLRCEGLGKVNTLNIDRLIDKNKSLNEGAIDFPTFRPGGWRLTRYIYSGLFDNNKKLKDYNREEWHNLIYADSIKLKNPGPEFPKTGIYEGILPRFERSFFRKDSKEINKKNSARYKEVVTQETCPVCKGSRLNSNVLKSKINGKNIADCSNMQIDDLLIFIKSVRNNAFSPLLQSIEERLNSLIDIGLEYLTLSRETPTLSGGESQRIKLVRYLGSSLTDLTYIFDEPSMGLHPSDIYKLNKLLVQLRDKGNTVLIVEHDPDVISIADNIIDMGPDAGRQGGQIVYQGSFKGLIKSGTKTGNYLKSNKFFNSGYKQPDDYLFLNNITFHNLRNVSLKIPAGLLTVITGVAGSGKSSLVTSLLKKYSDMTVIDQRPLRGSKRSNTATYSGIMDGIRKLLADKNNVSSALFSSNSDGACPECKGLGVIRTDLAFLDAVEINCEECNGTGYIPTVLSYKYKGKNIVDILNMTVSEAFLYFDEPKIKKPLEHLKRTGLDYLMIGQSLDTLSGGERQRLKLSTELGAKGNKFVFDEPTTGLHGTDVLKLLRLFKDIVSDMNTVIIVEHNMDVISQSDWVIDIGPGAGKNGGKIIFEGNVVDLLKNRMSETAKYLRMYYNIS